MFACSTKSKNSPVDCFAGGSREASPLTSSKKRKHPKRVFSFFVCATASALEPLKVSVCYVLLRRASRSKKVSQSRPSPLTSSKCMGQKVFRHFDPFSYFLRQKLAILTTLGFQGSFFLFPKIQKNTQPTFLV